MCKKIIFSSPQIPDFFMGTGYGETLEYSGRFSWGTWFKGVLVGPKDNLVYCICRPAGTRRTNSPLYPPLILFYLQRGGSNPRRSANPVPHRTWRQSWPTCQGSFLFFPFYPTITTPRLYYTTKPLEIDECSSNYSGILLSLSLYLSVSLSLSLTHTLPLVCREWIRSWMLTRERRRCSRILLNINNRSRRLKVSTSMIS